MTARVYFSLVCVFNSLKYLSFEILWKDFREAGPLKQNKALEEVTLISAFEENSTQ